MSKYTNLFENKRVLVTGGTGSIGSVIVKKALENGASYVRVLSRHPVGQSRLEKNLAAYESKLSLMIGSIKDKEDVEKAMEGVQLVFHAAADKYVPACETNPLAAIKTNAIGSHNVIECASRNGTKVERVVIISTDKAAFPGNVMGATKFLAEKMAVMQALENDRERQLGKSKPIICCVRFGNVAASNGSAIPIFVNQIYNDQPVTLTDEKMTRFMMSIPQAVDLVLQAAMLASGGEIFVLKMKSLLVKKLIQTIIKLVAPRLGKDPSTIKIETIGIRPGEKLHELLMTPEELMNTTDLGELYKIMPAQLTGKSNIVDKGHHVSSTAPKMSYAEIETLLEQIGLLQSQVLKKIVYA